MRRWCGQWMVIAMLTVSVPAGCGKSHPPAAEQPTPQSSAEDAPSDAADLPSPQMAADTAEANRATLESGQPTPAPVRTAAAKPLGKPDYKSVKIEGVPHIRQKPDFCGEACAAMILQHLGHRLDQDDVFDQSGLSPLEGRGCYTRDLGRALEKIGFRTGTVWSKVAVRQAEEGLESHWKALHADLARGVASIVCTRFDEQPQTTEHFRLILGYDAETDEVLYHDPAIDQGAYLRMPREQLLRLWPLKYDRDQWTLVQMRLEPRQIRAQHATASFTPADYAQHIRTLKQRVPRGFHLVLQPPFVVLGDEPAKDVERRAEGTVKWAVDRLKQDFFDEDPGEILDIWLFRDKASYDRHAKAIFNDRPTTPFGYYSPRHKALIMNIGTGGGTLVHEIVHPFVAADFPQCPSWLNEGLGSLFEQCGDQDGHIHGYTNWRLAGLQQAIRAESVPSFETLTSTTRNGFYNRDPGTNYAQARYLCYYLQEQGLLVKFYRQFRKDWKKDPTGYQTLAAVLRVKPDEMDAFQKKWEAYVLKLRFGR